MKKTRPAKNQMMLFCGLSLCAGQMDLFATDGENEEDRKQIAIIADALLARATGDKREWNDDGSANFPARPRPPTVTISPPRVSGGDVFIGGKRL